MPYAGPLGGSRQFIDGQSNAADLPFVCHVLIEQITLTLLKRLSGKLRQERCHLSGLTSLVTAVVLGSLAIAAGVAHMQPQKAALVAQPTATASRPVVQASSPSSNTAMLYADPRGHFFADVAMRGVPIRTLVDTGASLVALSAEDATKLGLRAAPGDRKARFSTANGMIEATLVRIPDMRLQGITLYDVEAAIMPPGATKITLLGMSFMQKLTSFESRGTSMTLRK